MKTPESSPAQLAALLVAGAILGAGCASTAPAPALPTVGPAADHAGSQSGAGNLVVYSAYEVFFVGDPDFVHHTRYAVCDAKGNLIKRVVNSHSDFDPSPVSIALPAGRYVIRARAAKYGMISIPTVVAPHLTTTLYLDGVPHKEAAGWDPAKTVSLPNGQVVGPRAAD